MPAGGVVDAVFSGAAGAALYTQLASLRQYLDRSGLAPAEFYSALEEVNPEAPHSPDVEAMIRDGLF